MAADPERKENVDSDLLFANVSQFLSSDGGSSGSSFPLERDSQFAGEMGLAGSSSSAARGASTSSSKNIAASSSSSAAAIGVGRPGFGEKSSSLGSPTSESESSSSDLSSPDDDSSDEDASHDVPKEQKYIHFVLKNIMKNEEYHAIGLSIMSRMMQKFAKDPARLSKVIEKYPVATSQYLSRMFNSKNFDHQALFLVNELKSEQEKISSKAEQERGVALTSAAGGTSTATTTDSTSGAAAGKNATINSSAAGTAAAAGAAGSSGTGAGAGKTTAGGKGGSMLSGTFGGGAASSTSNFPIVGTPFTKTDDLPNAGREVAGGEKKRPRDAGNTSTNGGEDNTAHNRKRSKIEEQDSSGATEKKSVRRLSDRDRRSGDSRVVSEKIGGAGGAIS